MSNYPDGFTSDAMPPLYRMNAADRAKLERQYDYDDLAEEPRRIQNVLEVMVMTLRDGVYRDLAWAADLANYLDVALSDADAFSALHIGDHVDLGKAIDLLSAQAVRS